MEGIKQILRQHRKWKMRPSRRLTAGGFHSQRFEQGRVSQGQLNHLADLCHLPPAATDVVVALLDRRRRGSRGGRRGGRNVTSSVREEKFMRLLLRVTRRAKQPLASTTPSQHTTSSRRSSSSRLTGSPSQKMTVSGATIQYGAGSVSTTLNSTGCMA